MMNTTTLTLTILMVSVSHVVGLLVNMSGHWSLVFTLWSMKLQTVLAIPTHGKQVKYKNLLVLTITVNLAILAVDGIIIFTMPIHYGMVKTVFHLKLLVVQTLTSRGSIETMAMLRQLTILSWGYAVMRETQMKMCLLACTSCTSSRT